MREKFVVVVVAMYSVMCFNQSFKNFKYDVRISLMFNTKLGFHVNKSFYYRMPSDVWKYFVYP